MLEQLYTIRRLTSTRIAKDLNLDSNKVVSLFSKLKKDDGIIIKPEVLYTAYGLNRITIEIPGLILLKPKDKPLRSALFIRSIYNIIPHNVLHMTLDTPIECENISNILKDFTYSCLMDTIGSRPKILYLYKAVRGDYQDLLDPNNIDEILYKLPLELYPKRRKIDGVDLDILQVMSKYPFLKQRHLKQKLEEKYKQEIYASRKNEIVLAGNLNRHIEHAEYLIRGYRVSQIKRVAKDSQFQLIYRSKCVNLESAALKMSTHPLVPGTAIIRTSYDEKLLQVAIIVPRGYYGQVQDFFLTVHEKLGCKIIDSMIMDQASKLIFTSGARITGEYDSRTRWKELDYNEIVVLLRRLVGAGILKWLRRPPEWWYREVEVPV